MNQKIIKAVDYHSIKYLKGTNIIEVEKKQFDEVKTSTKIISTDNINRESFNKC